MQSLQIEVEPAPKDIRFLEDRLYDYNVEQTGFDDGKWLSIFVRDDAGEPSAIDDDALISFLGEYAEVACDFFGERREVDGLRGQRRVAAFGP
mgnify:CR=1 FL=1